MKNPAFYIKTIFLMAILTAESYFLIQILFSFVQTEDYFSPSFRTLGTITGMLLLLTLTYSLTVGAWRKWEQYAVVSAPISIGIFIALLPINSIYAILIAAVSFLIISYDVFIATLVKDQMIKFDPRIILRFATRGLIFLFAVISAILVFLHHADKPTQFDLGSKVADLAQNQFQNIMQPQLITNVPSNLQDQLDGKELPPSPEQFGLLEGLQGDTNSLISGLPNVNLDLRETVKNEVDKIIAPYRQFIPPLIALVIFALIKFLGVFAHLGYNLLIPLLFSIAKKVGLLHVSYRNVQKEELTFTKKTTTGPAVKQV